MERVRSPKSSSAADKCEREILTARGRNDEQLDTVQEIGSLRHKNEVARENYAMTSFFLTLYCKDDRIKEGNEIGKYSIHASDGQFFQRSGRKD